MRQMGPETPRTRRLGPPLRYLALLLAATVLTGAAIVLFRPALPDRRPVVLTVYCASSAAWVTTLSPFLGSSAPDDGAPEPGRVTAERIKSAYERRCAPSD